MNLIPELDALSWIKRDLLALSDIQLALSHEKERRLIDNIAVAEEYLSDLLAMEAKKLDTNCKSIEAKLYKKSPLQHAKGNKNIKRN